VVTRNARLAQSENGLGGVPDRRHTGLHAEGRLRHHIAGRLLDAQLFKLVARSNHLRIVFGIAQCAQSDNGIQHSRIDGAQAIRHLQTIKNPLLCLAQRKLPDRTQMNRFGPVHQPVQNNEEIPP